MRRKMETKERTSDAFGPSPERILRVDHLLRVGRQANTETAALTQGGQRSTAERPHGEGGLPASSPQQREKSESR
jgi:hypothetical protein